MTAKASADISAVLGAYDFGCFDTVADIGGGRRHLLAAVLDAAPSAQGILFDLPQVINSLTIKHNRLTPLAGDFFADPLPQADAYLLMEVLHDWTDDKCRAILRAIRQAAPSGAKVLVIENVLSDDQPDPRGHILDIIMLANTGGRNGPRHNWQTFSTARDSMASQELRPPARCASWRPQPPERPLRPPARAAPVSRDVVRPASPTFP